MSYELNKQLADLWLPCDYIFNDVDEKVELANYRDIMVGYTHDQVLTPYAEFDPCNNWNDIMPIVTTLGVDYQSYPDGSFIVSGYYECKRGMLQSVVEMPCTAMELKRYMVSCCIKVLEAKKQNI